MRQRKISLKKCKKRKIVKKEENGYTLFTEKWFQQLGIKNFSENCLNVLLFGLVFILKKQILLSAILRFALYAKFVLNLI